LNSDTCKLSTDSRLLDTFSELSDPKSSPFGLKEESKRLNLTAALRLISLKNDNKSRDYANRGKARNKTADGVKVLSKPNLHILRTTQHAYEDTSVSPLNEKQS